MYLIALPFQKQFYTYLPQSPIWGQYTVADLPPAYHNLVNRQNGGYTSKSYFPTHEPTSDSLSAVYIPYIAGIFAQKQQASYHIPSLLYQNQFQNRKKVPDTAIIFYEDENRVVFFDYKFAFLDNEPCVRYIDFETDQWLTLADTFSEFIAGFELRYFELPAPSMRTFHRGNAAFLSVNNKTKRLKILLEEFEDTTNKYWYFEWLIHYGRSTNEELKEIAQEAFEFQKKFFRLQLPNNYPIAIKAFQDVD